MSSRVSVSLTALVVAMVVSAGVVGGLSVTTTETQSGDYTISIDDSISVPERTVTVEGDSYTVDALAQRAAGDSLSVNVDAPAGQEYDLYLYNRQIQIEQTQPMNGSDSASFATDGLQPSTYFVAVYYDGKIQKIHPLVIQGYTVSLSADSSVERGQSVEATLDLSRVDGDAADPTEVQAIIGNESSLIRVNATETGGSYEASIPTEALSPGTYALYGVVRGPNKTSSGDLEALGISDRQDVTIESATTPTDTPTPTDAPSSGGSSDPDDGSSSDGGSSGGSSGGSTGGSSGGSSGSSSTPTSSPTPTDITTPTATDTPTTAATPTATPTPTATDTPTTAATTTPTATDTPTPTDEDVITPASPTSGEAETETTSDGQPGFGVIAAVVAFLAAAALLARRQRD